MPKNVLEIYPKLKSKKSNKTFFLLLLLFVNVLLFAFLLLLILGKFHIIHHLRPFEIIRDMDYQNKLTPTHFSVFFDEKTRNLLPLRESSPLENNIYRFEPYEFLKAEQIFNKNPVSLNNFTLKRGEILYERYCAFCHGRTGKGEGENVTKVMLEEGEEGFPPPKDLTSKSARNLADGRLFHILSAGQNLMFPFHDRLNSFDKWCIIHYIRKIQSLQ